MVVNPPGGKRPEMDLVDITLIVDSKSSMCACVFVCICVSLCTVCVAIEGFLGKQNVNVIFEMWDN